MTNYAMDPDQASATVLYSMQSTQAGPVRQTILALLTPSNY